MDWGFIASLVIGTVAILGIFVEIPIISDYAFWVMTGSWLLLIGVGVENARKSKKKK